MGSPSWSDGLSPEQQAAASHFGAHARLLAGPGTGKTHTLSRRVVYLVTEKNVSPSEILVLTFTRMATRQLFSTIKKELAPYSNEMPLISTIHAFSLRQLLRNAKLVNTLPQPLRIADDWEESKIIFEDMKRLLDRNRAAIREGFAELSADWQTLQADADNWKDNLPDAPFVGAWEEHRQIYGYTLRAELVYQLKKAMDQVVGFQMEPRFQHVLIDEYQDLNPCDLAIVQSMAGKGMVVLASGDDDQSIYGFRFADPSGIRTFTSRFLESADLALTECRRCDADILKAAVWVSEQDVRRVPKQLHAAAGRDGGDVHILAFQSGQNEAQGIADLCRQMIADGVCPGEILILVRSDHQGALSRPLLQALEQCGVPTASDVGEHSVLDERPGRKLLSMLRLIANPNDHLAWRTRLEAEGRIGPKSIDVFYEFARQNGIQFSDAVRRLNEFAATLRQPAPRLLEALITRTLANVERFSKPPCEQDQDGLPPTTDDLKATIGKVAETEILEEEGRADILAFIAEVIDSSNATTLDGLFAAITAGPEAMEAELDPTRVNVLTMHQAKGLSADVVFLMGVEDEVLPRHEDARSVEEERRLLYVSMTRARHKLFMTYAGRRDGPQRHSGRSDGRPQRRLTRYLRPIGLRPEPGEAFVRARTTAQKPCS